MRNCIVLLLCAFALCACASVEDRILRTGDLVFVAIADDGADPSVRDLYIHTAMVDVDDEGVWILDATAKRGVARYPLDTFIVDYRRHDGSFPTFEVFRLKDGSGTEEFMQNARKYLGEKYDVDFVPDNGSHYCTELVYDSYIRGGRHIFETGPMDFSVSGGDVAAFWVRTFGRIGAEIPQGREGTDPKDMRASGAIEYLFDIPVPEAFLED